MTDELRSLLESAYQQGIKARIEDDAEALSARESGDMSTYFDLSLRRRLADVCWSLEKWDEASQLYRRNAQILAERRAWRSKKPELDTSGISDWEAVTSVKAGDLETGRAQLRQAIDHWKGQQGSELTLSELGLHAAQAQSLDLAHYATSVVAARLELSGGTSEAATQARRLLHYEPVQIALLLGRWDQFGQEIEQLNEAERLVKKSRELVFPEPLQLALLAACRGFRAIASVHGGGSSRDRGRNTARQAFEEAMLHFYRFNGQVSWDLYFMRLNTRLVDEAAAGRPLNPNPFADDRNDRS